MTRLDRVTSIFWSHVELWIRNGPHVLGNVIHDCTQFINMIILIAKFKLCAIEHLHEYERFRKIVAANIAQIEGLSRKRGSKVS